jgi:hypothetical protein
MKESPWLVPGVLVLVVLGVGAGSIAYASMSDSGPEVTYPERPSNLSTESATSFVTEYERAHAKNDIYDRYPNVAKVEFRVTESSVLNHTDGGFVIHLEIFLSWKDGEGVADQPYAVNYFVNESVVVRSEFRPEASPGPDPWTNGTVVEEAS